MVIYLQLVVPNTSERLRSKGQASSLNRARREELLHHVCKVKPSPHLSAQASLCSNLQLKNSAQLCRAVTNFRNCKIQQYGHEYKPKALNSSISAVKCNIFQNKETKRFPSFRFNTGWNILISQTHRHKSATFTPLLNLYKSAYEDASDTFNCPFQFPLPSILHYCNL